MRRRDGKNKKGEKVGIRNSLIMSLLRFHSVFSLCSGIELSQIRAPAAIECAISPLSEWTLSKDETFFFSRRPGEKRDLSER